MSATDRLTGRVKWFNNKAGYGFITGLDGDLLGKDIFVHYSKINISDSQYKYLVQGEYVEFDLDTNTNGEHEFQATNISGIKSGPIMCETRRANSSVNGPEDDVEAGASSPVGLRRSTTRTYDSDKPRIRPQVPRRESANAPDTGDEEGFKTVARRAPVSISRKFRD